VVGSGDELCAPLSALFQVVAHHHPTVSHLLLQVLFTETSHRDQILAHPPFSGAEACQPSTFPDSVYWKFMRRSAPCPTTLLWCSQSTPPSLLHDLFSSLFIIQFFLWRGGQSVQGAMLVYPKGGCVSITCCLFAHLLVCVSQAGLELASGSSVSFWFFSIMWCAEALGGLGVRGVRVLVLSGGIFCQVWFNISARFLIYVARTVCFLPLATILDSLLACFSLNLVFFTFFSLWTILHIFHNIFVLHSYVHNCHVLYPLHFCNVFVPMTSTTPLMIGQNLTVLWFIYLKVNWYAYIFLYVTFMSNFRYVFILFPIYMIL
jgi:hypothetical protein